MTRHFPDARIVFAWTALLIGAAPFTAATAQQQGGASGLRELTTDRPDTTESPFTVNSGHVQFETTLFGYGLSAADASGDRETSFEFAETNIRIGLTSSLELDVVIHPYAIASTGRPGSRRDGVGAVDIRAKLNLWGNDGGKTALALLPYVSIPADRRNGISPADVEYGLLVPLAIDLGGRFGLGLNAGVTVRRDDPTLAYRAYGIGTASLAVEWSDAIGSYYEIAVEGGGVAPASTSLNTGITWRARDNMQFDVGTQFGVSGDAPKFGPFIGFSLRL